MATGPIDAPDHAEVDLGVAAAGTDRGRRHLDNQDTFALQADGGRVVWAVCDGVSSSTRPEVAARAAADAAVASLAPLLAASPWPDGGEMAAAVADAGAAAEDAVLATAEPGDPTSATTLVLGVLGPDEAAVGGVGDSRVYWVDGGGGRDRLLTEDDSWAQEAIRGGIPAADAYASAQAHVITRCLRTDAREPTPPRVRLVGIDGPGHLVACTDGLWNYVEPPDELAALVASADDPTPIGIVRHLIEFALNAGGSDNVTVAVIAVGVPAAT